MSSTPDWADVAALLDTALDLPHHEREEFLAASPAAPHVVAAVRRLLAAEPEAASFLDSPAADYAAPLVAHALAEPDHAGSTPDRIGAWRIIREVGHGGMGAVYLAERDDAQFSQRVAIKLVREGAGDEGMIRRFLDERQILASLDHSFIARLIDGGVTGDGIPWFAMEYVEGVPIDRYCDEHGLDVDDRIELCRAVCEAVDHAHRKLVVHRDLKPSNILVTGDGTPKLLDFGIARLVPGDGVPDATRTAASVLLMTPLYASPEQLRGDRVTTATDVYSLGVLLYMLLTGRHPHGAGAETAPHELARVILEGDVARPSANVTRGLPDMPATRLSRRLRGDLDTILLMALRREPERRYPSARAFADDLGRHLAGHPVTAQPDTMRYRAGKFASRHRAAVVAAMIILITLSGGLAGTSWQAAAARREAQRAEQVKDFLAELFRASNPSVARGEDPPASELLARGIQRIDLELDDNPALKAELLLVLGSTMLDMGALGQADTLLHRAYALQLRIRRPTHASTMETRAALGRLLEAQGDYAAAESLLRGLLHDRRRFSRRDPGELASTLLSLGGVLEQQGEYREARDLYLEGLAIERRLYGNDAPETATTLNNLGVVLERMGAYEDAAEAHRDALRIRQTQMPSDHPDLLTSQFNFATVLMSLGANGDAEAMFREVLEQRRRVYRGDHAVVAVTLNNLAMSVERQGRLPEAETLDVEALAMRRRLLGEEHPDVAASANNIAVRAYRAGDLATAEAWMREALRIWRITLPAAHPNLATAINNLGAVLSEQRRFDAAEPLLREALSLRLTALDDGHADIGASHRNIGILLHRTGRLNEAQHHLEQARQIIAAALPPEHLRQAEAGVAWGSLLVDLRRAAEAEPVLRDGLERRRAALPPGDWRIGEAAAALGHALLQLGRPLEAEALFAEAVDALAGHGWASSTHTRQQAMAGLTATRQVRTAVSRE
jgi:eukaryotic-like serine/threonine-protein kinase